jgi:hypothetical protein
VGQRYSDFNACQEQADIHQGLLVRSGDRLFSPQLFFSTFQKWHSKFATHRQAAGLQCSTLGIVAPGKATTDLKAKIDCLLSEQGIDQAQFGYHEEEEVQGCGSTAKPSPRSKPPN